MNWLAHIHLSPPDDAHRIGNLLPDILPAALLPGLPEPFRPGVEQHRRIDTYTDQHPIVKRSIRRLEAPWRRYGGILVDMVYDHFLARDWTNHCATPLRAFVDSFYASIDTQRAIIPREAWLPLDRMREQDWLGSYAELAGVETALRRISRRFRRPVRLDAAMPEIGRVYDELQMDFREFYPQLTRDCACPLQPASECPAPVIQRTALSPA